MSEINPAKNSRKDPQLDYAIDHLLDKIRKEPKLLPPEPPFPIKAQK